VIGDLNKKWLGGLKSIHYHGKCPDGIGARQILKQAMPHLQCYPYYFEKMREVPWNSIFIDCSPSGEQLRQALQQNCIIAEHHGSRLDELKELMEEFPGQIIFGEGTESGTWLAFAIVNDYLDKDQPKGTEEVAELIALSDTWQKNDKRFTYARMLAGYIAFFGNNFDTPIHQLHKMQSTIEAFGAVERARQQAFADGAIVTDRVYFINDVQISDASEILRSTKGARIIVGWLVSTSDTGEQNVKYSLRSSDSFHSGNFCKAHGGGGHPGSAGFSVPYTLGLDPIQNFLTLLEAYEPTSAVVSES
jgi:oligoribonuclease NrnB/cAMP/cGMP phosphodiesterase (DHH superfamily)